MLKQEFEQLIGKEVTYDTFRLYEEMYLATPENVTKQMFVQMLNIDAIPESEDAIARRLANEERIKELREQISERKQWIKSAREDRERYKIWSKEPDGEMWKRDVKIKDEQIRRYKAEIAELEFLLAA